VIDAQLARYSSENEKLFPNVLSKQPASQPHTFEVMLKGEPLKLKQPPALNWAGEGEIIQPLVILPSTGRTDDKDSIRLGNKVILRDLVVVPDASNSGEKPFVDTGELLLTPITPPVTDVGTDRQPGPQDRKGGRKGS
jgi:hypothetical protein